MIINGFWYTYIIHRITLTRRHIFLTLSFFSFFLFSEIRLRQDSQLLQSRSINWSSSQEFQMQNLNGSTNSNSSSCNNIRECSESNSSTETLKWLGSSMSDVSVVSQATNTSTLSGKSQHIFSSSRGGN